MLTFNLIVKLSVGSFLLGWFLFLGYHRILVLTPTIEHHDKYFISKAGIRHFLGFGNRVTEYDSAQDHIFKLQYSQEELIIAIRDHDMRTLTKFLSSQNVSKKFTLITMTTADSPPGGKTFDLIYNHEKLKYWYTMNYHGKHPNSKMRVFPLGIDFHTMHHKQVWGESKTNWKMQNSIVHDIFSNAKQWDERPHLLLVTDYSNTHKTRTSKEFKAIATMNGIYHLGHKPRWNMLKEMAKAKFVLAPRGLGMSSIRFYEALMVGAIPICDELKSDAMNNLHRMLGAIIVKNWTEVNVPNLNRWVETIMTGEKSEDDQIKYLKYAKRDYLYTKFWLDCVRKGEDCVKKHFETFQL